MFNFLTKNFWIKTFNTRRKREILEIKNIEIDEIKIKFTRVCVCIGKIESTIYKENSHVYIKTLKYLFQDISCNNIELSSTT